jgi:hypothetical protein
MTKKLQPHESIDIVRKALERVRPSGDLNLDETLGQLMPEVDERDEFQRTLQRLVREKNFHIKPAAIPILPHIKLDEIVKALTMSALPGDPTTEKPEYEELN